MVPTLAAAPHPGSGITPHFPAQPPCYRLFVHAPSNALQHRPAPHHPEHAPFCHLRCRVPYGSCHAGGCGGGRNAPLDILLRDTSDGFADGFGVTPALRPLRWWKRRRTRRCCSPLPPRGTTNSFELPAGRARRAWVARGQRGGRRRAVCGVLSVSGALCDCGRAKVALGGALFLKQQPCAVGGLCTHRAGSNRRRAIVFPRRSGGSPSLRASRPSLLPTHPPATPFVITQLRPSSPGCFGGSS